MKVNNKRKIRNIETMSVGGKVNLNRVQTEKRLVKIADSSQSH